MELVKLITVVPNRTTHKPAYIVPLFTKTLSGDYLTAKREAFRQMIREEWDKQDKKK